MGDWDKVKWSEAAQVLAELGQDRAAGEGKPVRDYYEGLKTKGHLSDAAKFLAQALPRWEAVAWAVRSVRDLSLARPGSAEARSTRAALMWVQDPTEARRRAAFDATKEADPASADALAALAVFYSGGSVTPENCEPISPPRSTAGLFAAGAVRVAASRQPDPTAALLKALEVGEALAQSGAGVAA